MNDIKDRIEYDVVFCDDVREERYGKISMMGVYTDRMQVVGGNAVLKGLSAVVRVRFLEKSNHSFVVKMKAGTQSFDMDAMEVDNSSSSEPLRTNAFIFNVAPIRVDTDDKISIVLEHKGWDAITLGELNIDIVEKLAE